MLDDMGIREGKKQTYMHIYINMFNKISKKYS